MDTKIRAAIQNHEDFQRLKNVFPLEFIVDSFTNPNRGPQVRFIGNLLEQEGENPSLFIEGMLYHEWVEFEESRKLGYNDAQLGESNANDPNYAQLHLLSKRKELGFHKYIGKQVLTSEPDLPFLSIVLATMATGMDYQMPIPPYRPFCKMIQKRIREGMTEYNDPFTLDHVQNGIKLFKLGGDDCSGEAQSLALAREILDKGQHVRERTIFDII